MIVAITNNPAYLTSIAVPYSSFSEACLVSRRHKCFVTESRSVQMSGDRSPRMITRSPLSPLREPLFASIAKAQELGQIDHERRKIFSEKHAFWTMTRLCAGANGNTILSTRSEWQSGVWISGFVSNNEVIYLRQDWATLSARS